MVEPAYQLIDAGPTPIKAWIKGVPVEAEARRQLAHLSRLPFIHKHIAVMPDVHWGKGATVGCVIPCRGAIVPAAVGVDIGCGMLAVSTSLTAEMLPDSLAPLRNAIEVAIPHGRTSAKAAKDRGAWGSVPADIARHWTEAAPGAASLQERLAVIVARHPKIGQANSVHHLGTLGTGNHFIEVSLDEGGRLWVILHSGSRGVGNRIGSYFIERAKRECERAGISLPDPDLAYLPEENPLFQDYVEAVGWAQAFARSNRKAMMERILAVLARDFPAIAVGTTVVDCHHNYVTREEHFGSEIWLTRKGAVRARRGDLGIIPGSMGARSYIVRGKGDPDSFHSCAHGAGRAMSRGEAKRRFTVADHVSTTAGVECRKDQGVIDETPGAYKDIDQVMAAQTDLVEVVHTLKQVLCVKG